MKKIIIGFTLLLSLASFTAFASGEDKISRETLLSFNNQFKNAANVSWTRIDEISKASFSLNGFHVEAYYDDSGLLLGTARNILFDQLPLVVMSSINNRFGDVPVYEIVEYNHDGETFYTMKVETTNKKLQVRSSIAGGLVVEKRTRK